MKNDSLVIWRDADPVYKAKEVHCRSIRKPKQYYGFNVFRGEIPVVVINDITKQAMEVVNNRGTAYACRKRLKYRKNKNIQWACG